MIILIQTSENLIPPTSEIKCECDVAVKGHVLRAAALKGISYYLLKDKAPHLQCIGFLYSSQWGRNVAPLKED